MKKPGDRYKNLPPAESRGYEPEDRILRTLRDIEVENKLKLEQEIAMGSLAMDLKRVALGLQRGSTKMVDRFKVEALKRIKELKDKDIHDTHLQKLIEDCQSPLVENNERLSEDALMYSTLFQNFARKK